MGFRVKIYKHLQITGTQTFKEVIYIYIYIFQWRKRWDLTLGSCFLFTPFPSLFTWGRPLQLEGISRWHIKARVPQSSLPTELKDWDHWDFSSNRPSILIWVPTCRKRKLVFFFPKKEREKLSSRNDTRNVELGPKVGFNFVPSTKKKKESNR